jgi:hypothetical protein
MWPNGYQRNGENENNGAQWPINQAINGIICNVA